MVSHLLAACQHTVPYRQLQAPAQGCHPALPSGSSQSCYSGTLGHTGFPPAREARASVTPIQLGW